MLKYCLFVVIFCGILSNFAHSMMCYYCTSNINGQCGSNPKSLWTVDCDDAILYSDYLNNNTVATGCMKRTTTYTVDGDDLKIVRECYYGDLHDTASYCLDKWSSFTYLNRIIDCEVCDSDGCNAATRHQLIHPVTAMIFAVIRLFTLLS